MRRLSGFSLMEMMVVLLIVAVVAAVTAPMISKKIVSSAGGDSPWMWAGLQHSIVYNVEGNATKTANIGGIAPAENPFDKNYDWGPRLYIETGGKHIPHITFRSQTAANKSTGHFLHFIYNNGSILLTNLIPTSDDIKGKLSLSTVIGMNAEATGEGATVIGTGNDKSTPATAAKFGTAVGTLSKASEEGATAVGKEAQATGTSSLALGINAKATDLSAIAIGSDSQSTGVYSVGLGPNVNSTSSYSTAIGYNASASGTYSTAIGSYANASAAYSTAIGANTTSSNSNEIVLGTSNTTVRIPGKLKVQDIEIEGTLLINGQQLVSRLMPVSVTEVWPVEAASTSKGTTDFAVLYLDSDKRLKNIGEAFKGGLAEIRKLEVFNYTYKKDQNKTPMVGVIAQDLQKIFPNAVIKGDDGFLRIRWDEMFYAMVNSIKELDIRVTDHDKKIEALEKQNTELQKKLDKLEQRLDKLEKKGK